MKRWIVTAVVLFVAGFAFRGLEVLAEPSDQCQDQYYYIDPEVIWCQPSDDWYYWSSYFGDEADLAAVLDDYYNWEFSDMFSLGNLELVAVAVHQPVDENALYVQVFRSATTDTSRYPSAEAQIEDSWIRFGDEQIDYEVSDVCFTPCGALIKEYESAERIFMLYPLREIDAVYTVVLYGAYTAIDNDALFSDIYDIGVSLAVADEPWSGQEPGGDQAGGVDHPVFVGGDIVSVEFSTLTLEDTVLGERVSESDSIYSTFPGATLEFFSDGTVVFTPLGIGTQLSEYLFPVSGKFTADGSSINFGDGAYDIQGGVLNFELYREDPSAVGTTYVWINGSLDLDTGQANITYQVSAGASTSAAGGQTQVRTINAQFVQEWSR